MSAKYSPRVGLFLFVAGVIAWLSSDSRALARVVDNFDDNTKTGWSDFTFTPGFGIPAETGGQFVFMQPPAGQAIFSASTKTSRTFGIQDGERLEFRVDLVAGGDKDSFAILAFIPTSSTVSSLGGYGLAK